MNRVLIGAVAALLCVAAGFFAWRAIAHDGTPALPPAPAATPSAQSVADDMAEALPAASEKTREQRRFARYDRDRNGNVGRDEYLAARRKAFARLDTDGDGRLSFDEYAAKASAKYAAADADRSGTLDAAEFATTRVERRASPPRCPPARARESDDG